MTYKELFILMINNVNNIISKRKIHTGKFYIVENEIHTGKEKINTLSLELYYIQGLEKIRIYKIQKQYPIQEDIYLQVQDVKNLRYEELYKTIYEEFFNSILLEKNPNITALNKYNIISIRSLIQYGFKQKQEENEES